MRGFTIFGAGVLVLASACQWMNEARDDDVLRAPYEDEITVDIASGGVDLRVIEAGFKLFIIKRQNRFAVFPFRVWNLDLVFEAPRTQKSRVEAVNEVGGADDQNHLFFAKAVHFGEQLVYH